MFLSPRVIEQEDYTKAPRILIEVYVPEAFLFHQLDWMTNDLVEPSNISRYCPLGRHKVKPLSRPAHRCHHRQIFTLPTKMLIFRNPWHPISTNITLPRRQINSAMEEALQVFQVNSHGDHQQPERSSP